jgi:ribulose bisphosphate carboxylase small subunit
MTISCSYRIDRFDTKANTWSIARFAIEGKDNALAEMQAMRAETPGCQLRLIKIEASIVQEVTR